MKTSVEWLPTFANIAAACIPIEITLFGIIMTNIIIIKKTFITGIMGPEI